MTEYYETPQPGTPIAGLIFKPSTLECEAEIVAISP